MTAVVDSVQRIITATIPNGIDASKLVPTITVSGKATILPASNVVQDFTKPVIYTITAEDGTIQTFTVKIVVAKSSTKNIKSFIFSNLTPVVTANIDSVTKKIIAILPAGTDLTKLIPKIITSDRATVSPNSGVIQDFSKAVIYTVVAEDGSTQNYEVQVTLQITTGIVYIGSRDNKVYAIDAATGIKKWSYTTGDDVSSPIVANGVVYVGSDDNNLYAIDATTGIKKWNFRSQGHFFDTNIYNNEIVYSGSWDKSFYAIDAITGKQKWYLYTDWVSCPLVSNGVVYVGGYDKSLRAVDAISGKTKWSFYTNNYISLMPSISNGIVYISSGKTLYAIDAITGKQKWTFTSKLDSGGGVVALNGTVYLMAYDQNLYAIDADTGVQKWVFNDKYSLGYNDFVVENGIIYVGGDNLYAIDANTGIQKWIYSPPKPIVSFIKSCPTIVNGTLYVNSTDGNLYAFDAKTGQKRWGFNTGDAIYSSPCVVTSDGKVYRGLGNIHP